MAEKIIEVDGKRYMRVKKGMYYNKKNKRKMRHRHTIRWILVGFLTIFVIGPVGFVFGAFYEPGTKSNLPTATNYLDEFKGRLAEGLLEIPNGSFTAGVDEGSIDALLGYTRKMLDGSAANKFIGNFYCYIRGNNYEFVGDAQASFFQTKVHIYTTLDSSSDYLRFKINEISIGRLPLGNIAGYVLPKFLNEDTLNNMIKQANMRAKFSLANKEITYKKTEFREDMGTMMSSLLGESGATMGSLIFNLWDELEESGISFTDGITVKVNISKLMKRKEGEEVKKTHCTTSLRYKFYIKFIEKLINNGIIKSDDGTTMIKYLVKGYNNNDSKIVSLFKNNTALQNYTNEFLASDDLGIFPKQNYLQYAGDFDKNDSTKGFRYNHQDNIMDVLYKGSTKYSDSKVIIPDSTQISNFLITPGAELDEIHLKDNLLSDYIRSSDLVGPLFAMPITINNKTYYATLSVADFSFAIERINNIDYLIADADLNFYGATMPLRIYTIISTDGVRSIKFELQPDKIYLGDVSLNKDAVDSLLSFLKDSISAAGLLTFEVNPQTKKASFVLNIANLAVTSTSTEIEKVVSRILKNEEGTFTFTIGELPISYTPRKIGIKVSLDEVDNSILKLSFVNNEEQ